MRADKSLTLLHSDTDLRTWRRKRGREGEREEEAGIKM